MSVRSLAPPAAPPSADGSLAGTNSPVAHIDPSLSSHSPGSGDRSVTFQRPAEAPAVPHVAATTVPTAEAMLAQLEKEELDDKEPNFTRRGGLRCLGQYYAAQLNRRTMAHLRAELEADGELRQQFEKLLEKDGMDLRAWDEVTKWYDSKSHEVVQEDYQLGRPVGVSLASFSKFLDAWGKRCYKPMHVTTESDDEYDEQHHGYI